MTTLSASTSELDLQKALAGSLALRSAEAAELLFLIRAEIEGVSRLAQRLERGGNQVVLFGHGPIGTEPIGTVVFKDGTTVNDVLPTLSRIPGIPYLLIDDDGDIPLFSQDSLGSAVPKQTMPETPMADQPQPETTRPTDEPPPPGPFAPPLPAKAPRPRGGKCRVPPPVSQDATTAPAPPASVSEVDQPQVPTALPPQPLPISMREGDSRDAPDWAGDLEGEAEGHVPLESETDTEEIPDIPESSASAPNWADEPDWEKSSPPPSPPDVAPDTGRGDGPPEWLAEVIDRTSPKTQMPDESDLDEFDEDRSEGRAIVAVDEETPWEELFEECSGRP